MIRLITTFFYTGHLKPAPGTWGTAAGLAVGYVIHGLGHFPALALATLAVTVLGFWAVARAVDGQDNKDPSEIVIDEVAGIWIALIPVSLGAWLMEVPVLRLWPGWVVAVLAFRLFDIWKPGPIGWADRRPGAMGVMLDDIIAGVFAALCVLLSAAVSHGLMMR